MLGPYSPGIYPVILVTLGVFWALFGFATIIANSVFNALINDVVPQEMIGRFFGLFRALMPTGLFSMFFAKSLNVNMASWGDCIALTFCVSLVVSYPLGAIADRFHPLRAGLVLQAVYVLFSIWGGIFTRDAFTFKIALVGQGVIGGAWMSATASITQRLLPREQFGPFGAAAGIVSCICGMLVGPVVGMFLDHVGHIYRYNFLIAAGIEFAALFCGYVVYRKFMALGGPAHYVAPQ